MAPSRALGVALGAALLVAALLTPSLARAGTIAVWRQPDGHDTTEYHQGDRARFQDFGNMGPDGAVLVDLRTKQIVFLYDDSQAYLDFTKAVAKIRPKLERYAAKVWRKTLQKPPVDVHYLPIREKRTIAGFECEMFDLFEDGRVTSEGCFVPWKSEQMKSSPSVSVELVNAMAAGLFGKDVQLGTKKWTGDQKPPGYKIWSQEINPDRSRGDVQELISFKTEDLPAAIFSVPQGYHEVDQPLDPPRDGAARQRALRLARLSPRDSTDAVAPNGRRLTGIVALLIGVVFVFGVLFHAALLHVAASIVLGEARFSAALLASLITLGVEFPLFFLNVWLGIAAVVDLLAIVAGIRVAYRPSAGRTFVLLVFVIVLNAVAIYLLRGFAQSLGGR
jgi:hypothetical protein